MFYEIRSVKPFRGLLLCAGTRTLQSPRLFPLFAPCRCSHPLSSSVLLLGFLKNTIFKMLLAFAFFFSPPCICFDKPATMSEGGATPSASSSDLLRLEHAPATARLHLIHRLSSLATVVHLCCFFPSFLQPIRLSCSPRARHRRSPSVLVCFPPCTHPCSVLL